MSVIPEHVPRSFFSVRYRVVDLPPQATHRDALALAMPYIMPFFERGMPFHVKVKCSWTLAEPDEGHLGTFHLNTAPKRVEPNVVNAEIRTPDQLMNWVDMKVDEKIERALNSNQRFERLFDMRVLIGPGRELRAAGEKKVVHRDEPPPDDVAEPPPTTKTSDRTVLPSFDSQASLHQHFEPGLQ